MEANRRLFPVGWEQIHRDTKSLAWRLFDRGVAHKRIIAVTRGGLIPAGIIARELDIRLVDTACIVSYTHAKASATQGELVVLKAPELIDEGEDCLVIDDLVDSGKTLALMRKSLPKAFYATVYAKPAGRPMVDLYVTEVGQDTWIQFPWDTEMQYAKPLAER